MQNLHPKPNGLKGKRGKVQCWIPFSQTHNQDCKSSNHLLPNEALLAASKPADPHTQKLEPKARLGSGWRVPGLQVMLLGFRAECLGIGELEGLEALGFRPSIGKIVVRLLVAQKLAVPRVSI